MKLLKLEPYVDQSATLKLAQENVEAVYKIGKPKKSVLKDVEEVAKARFNVGDKVRIIEGPYGPRGTIGKVGTVTAVRVATHTPSRTGCVHVCDLDGGSSSRGTASLYMDGLELVERNLKFKVGDRVKVINPAPYSNTSLKGKVGIVISIDQTDCRSITGCTRTCTIDTCNNLPLYLDCFELVTDDDEADDILARIHKGRKLKKGDLT